MLSMVAMMGVAGCPQPSTVAEFRNDTASTVRVAGRFSSEQDIPEEVLEETGNTFEFDLAPGEVQSILRDCDDFQAVQVRGELRLLGDIGPEETTRVYRDGSDFGCGDGLIFRFTQSALGTDIDISFSASQ